MAVTLHKQANCGFVMLNSPPVNAINQKMREGLIDAVTWAESEGLERVIFFRYGSEFCRWCRYKRIRSDLPFRLTFPML